MKEGTYELKSTFTGYDDKSYEAKYTIVIDEEGEVYSVSGIYFDNGKWNDTHEWHSDIEKMMLNEKNNWIEIA